MKKLYRKFFYVPKYEKIPETVFLGRTALSAVTMLVCLVVLCSATLAYFSTSVTSGNNTIGSANYQLTVTPGEGATATNEDTYACTGNGDQLYTFTLTASGNAEKGYCKIYINGDTANPFFTTQINQGTVTILIKAADDTTVRFEPHWGTSSLYAAGGDTVEDGETVVCP